MHSVCIGFLQARRDSSAKASTLLHPTTSPARRRATMDSSAYIRKSPSLRPHPQAASPTTLPLRPHRSASAAPHLYPYPSPTASPASPLQAYHWSPRNIPEDASPLGQTRLSNLQHVSQAASAAALSSPQGQCRQGSLRLSRQRQGSAAQHSTGDSLLINMDGALPSGMLRARQQPAEQTGTIPLGRSTGSGGAAAMSVSPSRSQHPNLEGAPQATHPKGSPIHTSADASRPGATQRPSRGTGSRAVGKSLPGASDISIADNRTSPSPVRASKAAVARETVTGAGSGTTVASSSPRLSAKEQALWQQLQAANRNLQRGAACNSAFSTPTQAIMPVLWLCLSHATDAYHKPNGQCLQAGQLAVYFSAQHVSYDLSQGAVQRAS